MQLVAGCILLPNNFFFIIVVLHIGELCKEVQMIVCCIMANRIGWVETP
jgi:hypothetical protein